MYKVRPEYQDLIDRCKKVLPASYAATMRKKLERWSMHHDIRDEYFGRPGNVTKEEKIRELADKYPYSESNIDEVIYTK